MKSHLTLPLPRLACRDGLYSYMSYLMLFWYGVAGLSYFVGSSLSYFLSSQFHPLSLDRREGSREGCDRDRDP